MPKIKGPLLSLEAHGSLGEVLTYSKRWGKNYVRDYNKPIPGPSADQQTQRRIMWFLFAHWTGMTDTEKNNWEAKARASKENITGFHYFLKQARADLKTHHGLVGYWSMNRIVNGKVLDYSGQGNHGDLKPSYPSNAPTLVDGKNSKLYKALAFDGDDKVTLPAVVSNPTEVSFSAWYKSNVANTTEQRILTYNNDGMFIIISINGGTANLIRVFCYADTGGGWSATTTSYNVTNWHFIIGTAKNNDYLRLYVDGTEIGTGVAMGNMKDLGGDFARNIGTARDDTLWANGKIDEVRIYNRVLSADEIKANYKFAR